MVEAELVKVPTEGEPLSVILKLAGERCNLDCVYCFERRRDYGAPAYLDPLIVQDLLRRMPSSPMALELHGGEPLLYPKAKMVQLLRILSAHTSPVKLSMQSNGTLLTDAWLRIFRDEFPSLSIGISCDGPGAMAQFRLTMRELATDAQVATALSLCGLHSLSVGVACVLSRANISRVDELLCYFGSFPSIKAVKFIPCFDYHPVQGKGTTRSKRVISIINSASAGIAPWAISPAEYAEFLMKAWTVWEQKGLFEKFTLEPLLSYVRRVLDKPVNDCHFSAKRCAHVITVFPGGRVGGCDEFDGRLSNFDGGINAAISKGRTPTIWQHSHVSQLITNLQKKCSDCGYLSSCGGGCPAQRLRLAEEGLDQIYCDYRITLIDFVRGRLEASDQVIPR